MPIEMIRQDITAMHADAIVIHTVGSMWRGRFLSDRALLAADDAMPIYLPA